ncbi:amino acid permease [Formicincola oecophyllae]|uniref:Amino acid permease n=2 Tax=Formicincola oecophyllae TaxID=2558361 RepID=A0A4Y6UD82_9PROT|nr:amino acid permease [Formicincola oecophyllae]
MPAETDNAGVASSPPQAGAPPVQSSVPLYEGPLVEALDAESPPPTKGKHRKTAEGYHKGLSPRHVQMIAIGGAIGTGLFLASASRLQQAGPSLAIIYALCGLAAFMILRAMGQLVMYRPSSGSFVTYAREFLGEGAAYTVGWLFFLNWAMTGIVDITAVALYIHFWPAFIDIPQWALALGAMVLVGAINMAGVRYFGEIEFWLALIKVLAIVTFLGVASWIFGSGHHIDGHAPGLHMIADYGGFFPHGVGPALWLLQGVVFAYAATELIGIAAGECENPQEVVPRAVNSVVWRILFFYVGSIILLVLVLPWSAYQAGTSPFVTFFGKLGVPYADSVMNFVVLTAALSSLNSGLYSTGRVLRALAIGGSAPHAFARLNRNAVPYVAILATLAIYVIGVVLNYFIPSQVFEIVLSLSSLGILGTWACIILCQLRLHHEIKKGHIPPTGFAMPWAPYSGYLTLAFLVLVLGMMAFDFPAGTFTICAIPLLAVIFWVGWKILNHFSDDDDDETEEEEDDDDEGTFTTLPPKAVKSPHHHIHKPKMPGSATTSPAPKQGQAPS